MLHRFAAATTVASVAIALGAVTLLQTPAPRPESVYRLWCFLPAVWGLWAMLAPRTWVPERLPIWGGILGVVAGVLAIFVINVPAQVTGVELAMPLRGLGVALASALYYLLWMVVRAVYSSLTSSPLRQATGQNL